MNWQFFFYGLAVIFAVQAALGFGLAMAKADLQQVIGVVLVIGFLGFFLGGMSIGAFQKEETYWQTCIWVGVGAVIAQGPYAFKFGFGPFAFGIAVSVVLVVAGGWLGRKFFATK